MNLRAGVLALPAGTILKNLVASCASIALAAMTTCAWALPGTFSIEQIFSNADGSVQFVVIYDRGASDCDSGENLWAGQTLVSNGSEPQRTFVFPANLPTCRTSDRRILIATDGFAALALVTPDYVIPNGFVQRPGGTLLFAGISAVTYTALPSDGVTAIDGRGAPIPNRATNLAGASASVVPGATTAPDLKQHGLTGSWYEPATSGQGFEVEIFPAVGFAQVSWFTYDATAGGADRQRWFTLGGSVIAGQPTIALTIYRNTGGNFNAPPTTAAVTVGTATLRFDSCTSGQLDYSFSDGSNRSGSIPLTRLTQNVTCDPVIARPTNADFALSGNWFDPSTSGQGVTVELNPVSSVLFFAWYTYAPNGDVAGAAGQRWFTGQGSYGAGARSIAYTLYETTGGVFDAPSTPPPANAVVGSGTLAFQDCDHASLAFTFTGGSSAGRSGTIPLVRVGPAPPGCTP
jgi:hypothetical protein